MNFLNLWSSSSVDPVNTNTTRTATAYATTKRRGGDTPANSSDTRTATAYASTTRRPYTVETPPREYVVVDRPVYTPRFSSSTYSRPMASRNVKPKNPEGTFVVFCLLVIGMYMYS